MAKDTTISTINIDNGADNGKVPVYNSTTKIFDMMTVSAGGLTVGTTTITGGTTTRVLYDNAGVLGEYTISGTGNVAMTTSPAFTTPTLGVASATSLTLTGTASPTYTQGKLVYDTDNESLTFYNNDSNVSLQIGQEAWIRVRNATGSSIPNGSAVYINGASSGLPTIALAQANAAATTIGAGLTTETIANGAIGYVTCIGLVRDIDTSAFSAGATVFISATTPGALTSTAPTAPNYRYRVGIVGVSSATVGTIHVTPSTAALGNGTANQVFGMNTAGTAQEVKSLNGTTNRITATGGTNTITFDIAATYVGQTSITTLGTIGTGTWNGTAIGATFGGTGQTTVAQGDLLYGSATNTWSKLTKDTNATRYLSNTGTSNNPAWAQVSLANGVTGNLPVTNLNSGTGATSSTFWRGDGTWASAGGSSASSMVVLPNFTLDRTNPYSNAGATGGGVMNVGRVVFASSITVTRITFRVGTVFTAPSSDTTNWGLFSSDGSTRVATGSFTANANNTTVVSTISAVTIQPGIYYFGYSNQNTQVVSYNIDTTVPLLDSGALGYKSCGTYSISGNTIPTSITPSSITASGATTAFTKWDI